MSMPRTRLIIGKFPRIIFYYKLSSETAPQPRPDDVYDQVTIHVSKTRARQMTGSGSRTGSPGPGPLHTDSAHLIPFGCATTEAYERAP
jgi:hypothetical protein